MSSYWFAPAPTALSSRRLSLDLGLRAADLYFRDLVVPELGRVWFVRQLSWSVAALALHDSLAKGSGRVPKPTVICRGVEALACKLEYQRRPDAPSSRILGRRAFGRDTKSIWGFDHLRRPTNYVQNTHRQSSTRALRVDGGLGLATGTRFDGMALTPIGRELAEALLMQRVDKGSTTLEKWLRRWITGELVYSGGGHSLLRALSPECATPAERRIVKARLLETDTAGSQTRARLANALGREQHEPHALLAHVIAGLRKDGHSHQATEVSAAQAFGAVLDRLREAVSCLTHAIRTARGGVEVARLIKDVRLTRALRDVRLATDRYVVKATRARITESTSHEFAARLHAADERESVRLIVRRSGELLCLADDKVFRGSLFRRVSTVDDESALEDGAASIEPDRTGRTFRIANLHELLLECASGDGR